MGIHKISFTLLYVLREFSYQRIEAYPRNKLSFNSPMSFTCYCHFASLFWCVWVSLGYCRGTLIVSEYVFIIFTWNYFQIKDASSVTVEVALELMKYPVTLVRSSFCFTEFHLASLCFLMIIINFCYF